MEAEEDRIHEASGVADLYVQSWNNRLNLIKQLAQEPSRVGTALVEKLGSSSGRDGEGNKALTSSGDVENDAVAACILCNVDLSRGRYCRYCEKLR